MHNVYNKRFTNKYGVMIFEKQSLYEDVIQAYVYLFYGRWIFAFPLINIAMPVSI